MCGGGGGGGCCCFLRQTNFYGMKDLLAILFICLVTADLKGHCVFTKRKRPELEEDDIYISPFILAILPNFKKVAN